MNDNSPMLKKPFWDISLAFLIKKFLLRTRRFCHTREISYNNDESILRGRLDDPLYLERYGYKVFSQNDEDGIIEEIFNRIGTADKNFVEFGINNGLESNGHFLLHKGWKGLWIEGGKKYYNEARKIFRKPLSTGQLAIVNTYITPENINEIITDWNGGGGIDLLSIDIDGNDYHVWKAIKCVSPRAVIIEYNSKFPPTYEWIMPYNPKHIWSGNDYSGASLKSLEFLGNSLGYRLVGTNMNGINAFFVRNDLADDNRFVTPANAENLYNPGRYNIAYRTRCASDSYIGN